MKRAASSALILVSTRRIARADFDADYALQAWKSGLAPSGVSIAEQVRAALTLGGKTPARVWVLTDSSWTQKISLNPAQVAGLSQEQLERALSFEIEPYSGIPMAEGVVGFRQDREGEFSVVELSRADQSGIQHAIESQGATLAGIAHPGTFPESDDDLSEWLKGLPLRIQAGEFPLIAATLPAPSPKRFLIAGIALEAAAVLILSASLTWTNLQRKSLQGRHSELTAASRELEATNKSIEGLKAQLKSIEEDQIRRERVTNRRGALYALLDGLARTCPPDVLLRGIEPDGPSSLIVSGLSLEPRAIDELSIVLNQNLRASGWTAQLRRKAGRKTLANGGPWEFSLALNLDEMTRPQSLRLSQRTPE